MKKSTLMKLALLVMCAFLFVEAQAQNPVQINVNYTDVNEVVYQTATKTFRLYVAPDQVYSPGYDGDGTPALNPLSNWRWVTGASYAAGVQVKNWSVDNFIEIAAPVAGTTTQYWVSERYNALCNDATGTTKTVTVIAAPTAVITGVEPAEACGNLAAEAVTMTFTEAVPVAFAAYAFAVTEVVDNITAAGALIGNVSTNNTFVTYTTATKLKNPALTGAASPYGFSFNTSALNVAGGLRTRYTYTLVKATDAPGAAAAGVISAISQKSDVIGGTVLTHGFGAKTTWVRIVNPTPTTGPIYHVSNSFAF